MNDRGQLLAIAGPSGIGKTTICHQLLDSDDRYIFSVSCTTRTRRPNEADGVDYHFITREEFQQFIHDGKLAEWQDVFGNFYGTLKSAVQEALDHGKILLLDIEVKGTLNIKAMYPEDTITVFLLPPSDAELKRRLESRGTECEKSLKIRSARVEEELALGKKFDYQVTNDDLVETVSTIRKIVNGEKNI
ncbi:MAG: guanylate kinase [Candidatus Marinimicrobia bacterium]|nr:guanylate kinase [Candidatus Neomarinimicrobiota bacterium]